VPATCDTLSTLNRLQSNAEQVQAKCSPIATYHRCGTVALRIGIRYLARLVTLLVAWACQEDRATETLVHTLNTRTRAHAHSTMTPIIWYVIYSIINNIVIVFAKLVLSVITTMTNVYTVRGRTTNMNILRMVSLCSKYDDLSDSVTCSIQITDIEYLYSMSVNKPAGHETETEGSRLRGKWLVEVVNKKKINRHL